MSNDEGTTGPPRPQDAPEPKKGGFGAFAQQYRDRWAAGHPNVKPATPGAAPTNVAPTDVPPTDVPPIPADDPSASGEGAQP